MKCHYEVLNISKDADQAEIKTAYRKLALQWHPDKNLNDPDVAKEQFQLVQQAYEVLSDHQERAWYDNHREEILRGAQSNYEDDSLDLFQYFTTSCFKGYDDSSQSFYSVYSEVFSKLASEEIEYLDEPEDYEKIPIFGNSQSSYEVVKNFYSYWQGFSTKKSYAWLSRYNINETRDRRVVKLIDKENKKVQQKARRERNEKVRQLVQFVRKRDKRVIAQRKLEEERSQHNKLKAEQMRKEQIRQRTQELTAQVNTMQMDDLESQLREIEKNLLDEFGDSESDYTSETDEDTVSVQNGKDEDKIDSDSEENISGISNENKNDANESIDNLYCVACNKLFKTISSFRNHEKSKKHKDLIAILLLEMENDDAAANCINTDNSTQVSSDKGQSISDCDETLVDLETEKLLVSNTNDHENILNNSSSKIKSKKKQKLKTKVTQSLNDSDDDNATLNEFTHISSDSDSEWGSKPKTKQKKLKSVNKPKASNTSNNFTQPNTEKTKPANLKSDAESLDTDHVCVTCKGKFNSKNKLFAHLKSTGHGVALNSKSVAKEKKSKKK